MKKLAFEDVKKVFENAGCVLVGPYVNVRNKLKYRCSCGEEAEIFFPNFQKGQRCMNCSGNKRYSFEYAKKYFEKNDCKLLGTQYKNNKTPMKYMCHCGNIAVITFDSFKNGGARCMNCSGSLKYEFQYVKQCFEENNCVLLEISYKNARAPMKYICKCGTNSSTSFNHFRNGVRCINCSGKKKHELEDVQKYFEKNKCVLLEETYKNSWTAMAYICNCGETATISFSNFKRGHRCSFCKNKTERLVKNFLEENNSIVCQAKFEWCKAKRHLPFDFFLEKFKIIIEVDGLQHFKQVMNWQSPEETLKIDKLKSSLALKNGYSVIRISQEDVFNDALDWQKILSDCIKEYDNPVCVYISKDPQLYSAHKNND